MAFQKLFSFLAISAVLASMATAQSYSNPALSYDYYKYSCPNAVYIAKAVAEYFVRKDPTLAPALLRMDFHDCFVGGCDASILLDPTPANPQPEKVAKPNLSLRGYEVINIIKAELEKACPGVVSCSDVLRLAARDAVVAIKGPYWPVTLGRKDGKNSLASEAVKNLPPSHSDIATLKQLFAAKGLSVFDLVVLSGAHTIGVAHCNAIQNRLYNFAGKGITDPSLDSGYAGFLKWKCPKSDNDKQPTVYMDPISPQTFDEKYYTMVSERKGLFESDAALLNDYTTRGYLQYQVQTNGSTFGKDFGVSMTKMIQIGVLTGSQGEIRKTCGAVNSYY